MFEFISWKTYDEIIGNITSELVKTESPKSGSNALVSACVIN